MALTGTGIWYNPVPSSVFRIFEEFIDTTVISDGILGVGGSNGSVYVGDTLYIGKDFEGFSDICWIPKKKFEVSSKNSHFIVYDNALYTENYDRLLAVPTLAPEVVIHPDTKVICKNAFYHSRIGTAIVIPWGVTTIEDEAFAYMGTSHVVILPDTLTFVGQQVIPHLSDSLPTFFFSPQNEAAKSLGVSGEIRQELLPAYLKGATTIEEIYARVSGESTIIGWRIENEKWCYYEGPDKKKELDVQSPGYAIYEGCLYTSDFKKLLAVPYDHNAVLFHPDVEVICANSLPNYLKDELVIPWGVTTVENDVFGHFQNWLMIVVPETVVSFSSEGNHPANAVYMIWEQGHLLHTLVQTGTEVWDDAYFARYYPEMENYVPPSPSSSPSSQTEGSGSESSGLESSKPESQPTSEPSRAPATESSPESESSLEESEEVSSEDPGLEGAGSEDPSPEDEESSSGETENSSLEGSDLDDPGMEGEEPLEPANAETQEKAFFARWWPAFLIVLVLAASAGVFLFIRKKKE